MFDVTIEEIDKLFDTKREIKPTIVTSFISFELVRPRILSLDSLILRSFHSQEGNTRLWTEK